MRMRERLGTIAYAHCKQRFRARSRVPCTAVWAKVVGNGDDDARCVASVAAALAQANCYHGTKRAYSHRPEPTATKTHPWVSCTHSFTERRDGPLTEHDAPKLVVDADRRHPRSLERLLRISQQKTRLPNRTVPEQNDLHALVEILLGHEVQSDVRTLHNTYT